MRGGVQWQDIFGGPSPSTVAILHLFSQLVFVLLVVLLVILLVLLFLITLYIESL